MILQTGMRTDIPAFYSEWFERRIREGYVLVRNPYNPDQLTRYDIDPEKVDMFTFCTKDPSPMLPRMDVLKPYGQYWFVTITPYGTDIEENVPPWEEVAASFIELSKLLGPDCVGWRYDPILLNEKYTEEFHIEAFARMAEKLKGYTHTCVISFIDIYEKVRKNFPEAVMVGRDERLRLGKAIIETGRRCGMVIKPCGEGGELARYGADCSGCMTAPVYEKALGKHIEIPKRKDLRRECSCFLGNDIGAYNTCMHFCRYCYANYDRKSVMENARLHDPASPLLIGWPGEGEKIHRAVQKKWADDQLRFNIQEI